MIRYGFKKELSLPYEEVVVKVTEALKKEGFGILTEINIKDKLKEKLGVDFNKIHHPWRMQPSQRLQGPPGRAGYRAHAPL